MPEGSHCSRVFVVHAMQMEPMVPTQPHRWRHWGGSFWVWDGRHSESVATPSLTGCPRQQLCQDALHLHERCRSETQQA